MDKNSFPEEQADLPALSCEIGLPERQAASSNIDFRSQGNFSHPPVNTSETVSGSGTTVDGKAVLDLFSIVGENISLATGLETFKQIKQGDRSQSQREALLVALNEKDPFVIVDDSSGDRIPKGNAIAKKGNKIAEGELSPEQDKQLQAILKDPKLVEAAKKLSELLDAAGDADGRNRAQSLLSMLASSEKQDLEDGRQLLKMLNDPAKQDLAQRLLDAGAFDSRRLHNALTVIESPNGKNTANELVSLLKSADPKERAAAWTLFGMLSSKDPVAHKDAQELIVMMRDRDKQPAACNILSGTDDFRQVSQMLSLLHRPELKQASDELVKLLGSEKSSITATELLRLLDSKSVEEKDNGKRLLKLLNSSDEHSRAAAGKILNSVHDVDERAAILAALETSSTRKGAEKVLDSLSASTKKERKLGEDLLEMIARPETRGNARKILELLGGTEKEHGVAKTILSRLDNAEQHRSILNLLSSKDYPEATKQLLQWLDGTPEQRGAARALLELAASVPPRGPRPGPRPETPEAEVKSSSPVEKPSETLLKMIVDPDRQDTAVAILSKLQNTSQIYNLVELMRNPAQKEASQELVRMLDAGNYNDAKSVIILLEMSGSEASLDPNGELLARRSPDFRKAREQSTAGFMKMLANPGDRAAAKEMLAQLAEPLDSSSITPPTEVKFDRIPGFLELDRARKLYGQDKEAANKVLSMLNDPDQSALAREMLRNLENPAQLTKMLDILRAPENAAATRALRDLARFGSGEEVGALTRLLTDAKENTRKSGEELFKKLADPRESWKAQEQIRMELTPDGMRNLETLLADKEKNQAGQILRDMLLSKDGNPQAARKLLDGLSSDDKEIRSTAVDLVDMLADPNQKDAADTLINNFGMDSVIERPAIQRMMKALSNENERKGADVLLKYMSSASADDFAMAQRARSLAKTLGESATEDRRAAEKLFEMLCDPSRKQLAKNILENVDFRSLDHFLNLITEQANQTAAQKEAGKQLSAMMSSPDSADRRGVALILDLPTIESGPADYRDDDLKERLAAGMQLMKMLGNAGEQANARAILKKLETPQECAQLIALMQDPAKASAGKTVIGMLRSNDIGENLGAKILLSALATKRMEERDIDGRPSSSLRDYANTFVSLLNRSESRDLTRQALSAVLDSGQLSIVANMASDKRYHQDLKQLTDMLKGKHSETARIAIDQLKTPQQVQQLLALNGHQPEVASVLLAMLQDEETSNPRAAREVLSLLGSKSVSERKAGEQYLKMLSTSDQRETTQKILASLSGGHDRFLKILNAEDTRQAGQALLNLIDTGRAFQVQTLLECLESDKKDARTQAETILSMLNDSKYQRAAIRMLKQLPSPVSGNYG